MPYRRIHGFEDGTLLSAYSSGGAVAVQTSIARTGDYALRVNPTGPGNGEAVYGVPPGVGLVSSAVSQLHLRAMHVRFYFRAELLPASGPEVFFTLDADAAAVGVQRSGLVCSVDDGGLVSVAYFDGTGTTVAAGTTALATGRWYCVEATYNFLQDLWGRWELRIDQHTELAATVNYGGSPHPRCFLARLGKTADTNGNSVDFIYDDLAFSDHDWPGPGGCVRLPAASAGHYQGQSGGTYADIAEVPPSGSGSVVVPMSNAKATFGFDPAGMISGRVNAVAVEHVSYSSGASERTVTRLRVGGLDFDTTGRDDEDRSSSPTSAAVFSSCFAYNPATLGRWRPADVAGVEAGFWSPTSGGVTCDALYLMVDFEPNSAAVGSPSPVINPVAVEGFEDKAATGYALSFLDGHGGMSISGVTPPRSRSAASLQVAHISGNPADGTYVELGASPDITDGESRPRTLGDVGAKYLQFKFLPALLPSAGADPFLRLFSTRTAAHGSSAGGDESGYDLRIADDGTVTVVDFSTGEVLATARVKMPATEDGTWHTVGVYADLHFGVEVWIDGVRVAARTDAGFAIETAYMGIASSYSGDTIVFDYDDFVATDTWFPPVGVEVIAVAVSGDGARLDWAAEYGCSEPYQCVEDIPEDGDSTMLACAVASGDPQRQDYTLPSAADAGVRGDVLAVMAQAVVRRSVGASTPANFNVGIGQYSDADPPFYTFGAQADNIGTTFKAVRSMFAVDPDAWFNDHARVPWSAGAFDGLAIAIDASTPAPHTFVACTQAMLHVAQVPPRPGGAGAALLSHVI